MKFLQILTIVLILGLLSCDSRKKPDDNTDAYPDADAVYINMVKEYRLNQDGSIDFHYSHRLKLLTYYAFHRTYGETFIIYDPQFQQLKINHSVTTMADGKEVPAPGNAFNELLPRFAVNAPAYNHLREMVVTHTALERNAIIDLDYSIISSEDHLPFLSGEEMLSASSPVKQLTVIIRIPEDKELHYQLLNDSIIPEISTENKIRTYEWTFTNIPARSHEELQADIETRLIFSTAKEFEETRSFITSQDAFKYEINEQMKEKVEEITGKDKTKLNIALELQEMVVDEVNYHPVPFEYAGFRCRTPIEVWESNSGNEIEKTVLLISLFKAAGIDAKPVVCKSEVVAVIRIGVLQFFENFYVEIVQEKEESPVLYLSAITLNEPVTKFSSGEAMVSFVGDTISTTINFAQNAIISHGEFIVRNEKSLSGKIGSKFTKNLNPYGQLTKDKSSAKDLFSSVNSANIVKLEKDESIIDFEINKDDPFRIQANYFFWELPHAIKGIDSWHIAPLLEKRTTPLKLESKIKEEYSYNVKLPQNFQLVTPETKIEEGNSVGRVSIEIVRSEKGFIIKRSIIIKRIIIPVENYTDFRKLITTWNNKKYKELVLKKQQD
ncbi:MAG: DUF3857 domain-containing protein [Bacteroidota bacterium]